MSEIVETLKRCNACDVLKPIEDFDFQANKDSKARGMRRHKCRRCRARQIDWHQRNKQYIRDKDYQKRYGISLNDYNTLLESQNHKCKVCKKPRIDEIRRLAVDHDHNTGKIRGLLCDKCNRGLGFFQEDPDLLIKARDYLLEAA